MKQFSRMIAAFGLCFATQAFAEPPAALITALSDADVIFLGEIHDNPYHHQSQAAIIEALNPSAVVFEMLSVVQADKVRDLELSTAAELDSLIGWTQSGWPSMEIYFPIFQTLKDAIPYGALQPRFVMMRAYKDGAALSLGPVGSLFGLDVPLDEATFQARVELQFLAHCSKMSREMIPNMIEVQRMRDATLADAALTALGQTGGPVVVITGNGHARNDWGAPMMAQHADNTAKIVSLGHFEDGVGNPDLYDYTLVTPSVERSDPCDQIGE